MAESTFPSRFAVERTPTPLLDAKVIFHAHGKSSVLIFDSQDLLKRENIKSTHWLQTINRRRVGAQ
jgi:hypothetical protein